jgi:hypothetical protein
MANPMELMASSKYTTAHTEYENVGRIYASLPYGTDFNTSAIPYPSLH